MINKADRIKLQNKYGKGNYKIKQGHGGVETLYIKKIHPYTGKKHFCFESHEYKRVI